MKAFRDRDLHLPTLWTLLRAEAASGIMGLRLFIACTAIAALLLGAVWMLGNALATALERNGYAILGGDLAITVVNQPLKDDLVGRLAALPAVADVSRVVELRSTARGGETRTPIELKAVDGAYPLYGRIGISGDRPLEEALARRGGLPGAVVEETLLARLPISPGDPIRVGEREFEVRAILEAEPDRLSAGGFLVGPRVLISLEELPGTELLGPGALADFRYRLTKAEDVDRTDFRAAVADLTPERGWEMETPGDAGDRVRRTVARTTTFLGVAGIVALAIGLAGAWAAATVWVGRRARTIALYRLSGATPALVIALHGTILGLAALGGLALGFGASALVAVPLMDLVGAQLHLNWTAGALFWPGLQAAATLSIGIAGAGVAALSAAARTPPGQAMRSGEAGMSPRPRHAAIGIGAALLALALAVASLPIPMLAALAAVGLVLACALLAAGGWAAARLIARRRPKGFVGLLIVQGLSQPGASAVKALAIGIGIAGVTAVLGAQGSLERSLRGEIPAKVPDLVMIDVQPDQVEALRDRIAEDPALGGLQADPFMRTSILRVNGVPAEEALVRADKSWVIEGDRSFSWSAGPTGSELLAGEWWTPDRGAPPVIAPEEDLAQAFDLKPGDEVTYSVLGRTFTSEVVAIRKEYHRTFRPDYLLLASADPFRDAPHSWIFTLQGSDGAAIDRVIADTGRIAPNVTAIDVRRIVAQVRQVIDGAVLGSLGIAGILLVAGALGLAAIVAADVDARRREALAFALVGASRREIALARLGEALTLGSIAAAIGGAAGLIGGWWLTTEGLHVAWAPGWLPFVMPVVLGALAAVSAGAAGGMSALPRGRGQMARHLAG
ncbi:ABC transporter permease [Marivibrio halodurans]|uniref:ABC transporter permease n=1 Tax=Marivibrio halodurans TaxID=2039722 RepID=A0A8J7RWP4_9PROT|nr:ABC transporter permease [Marivibrio halodurans]MBP5855890.1 ABC transporter permease [Marivibrio halodurans]